MIQIFEYTRDVRIQDSDYVIDKTEKYKSLLPYLKRKIQGDWNISIVEPPLTFVRELYDEQLVPEYVNVYVYMDKTVLGQLLAERPQLVIKRKTAYEKYLDLIADMKIMIEPKAARELYRRVGASKDKLPGYLQELANKGTVTLQSVKNTVADERKTYASEVVIAFLRRDRWRWKKYDKLVSELGREYTFYAIRKFLGKLLKEKEKYLHNQDVEIKEVDSIDAYTVCHAWAVFNMTTSSELEVCMAVLENREELKSLI